MNLSDKLDTWPYSYMYESCGVIRRGSCISTDSFGLCYQGFSRATAAVVDEV